VKKSELSVDFTKEKPPMTQNNSPLHGFPADYTVKRHAFPRYNPRKVLTFLELYPGKACLSKTASVDTNRLLISTLHPLGPIIICFAPFLAFYWLNVLLFTVFSGEMFI
jgi:hypothetical protein